MASALEKFRIREAEREQRLARLEKQKLHIDSQLKNRQKAEEQFIEKLKTGLMTSEHRLGRPSRKEQPFSLSGKHQATLDRNSHSPIEIRFREIYGKWPSALEFQQAKRFLKLRRTDKEE